MIINTIIICDIIPGSQMEREKCKSVKKDNVGGRLPYETINMEARDLAGSRVINQGLERG